MDVSASDIIPIKTRQPSNRQLSALVSLWKLKHYKQSGWSSWTILYTQRRPRREPTPFLCLKPELYDLYIKDRDTVDQRELHQHMIWQHVQDRLALQHLEGEDDAVLAKAMALDIPVGLLGSPSGSTSSSATITSSPDLSPLELTTTTTATETATTTTTTAKAAASTAATAAATAAKEKRSIKWSLQYNTTRHFDKSLPITLVPVPAVDKRPTKSALKEALRKQTITIPNGGRISKTTPVPRKSAMDFF